MPILNYTTEVSATRTANELVGLLGAKGAKRVSIDYDKEGDPVAIEFMMEIAKQSIWFRLPCNVDGVHDVLYRQRIERRYKSRQHAQRVAWRIVKDWVAAQLAIVEARQAEMAEVFLPYVVDDKGQTMFQRFVESQQKLLPEGNVVEGNFKAAEG